jgi:hypothetical protein
MSLLRGLMWGSPCQTLGKRYDALADLSPLPFVPLRTIAAFRGTLKLRKYRWEAEAQKLRDELRIVATGWRKCSDKRQCRFSRRLCTTRQMSKETDHHDDEERREPSAVDGIRAHEPTHERKPNLPATALGCEGFVQPSSYLRRSRGLSKPMSPAKPPESAVDRDQRRGLVSSIISPARFRAKGGR